MQFTEEQIYMLIAGCEAYQQKTGSEYIFDKYAKLIRKLRNYQSEHETA